jgi:hypothetical protein
MGQAGRAALARYKVGDARNSPDFIAKGTMFVTAIYFTANRP